MNDILGKIINRFTVGLVIIVLWGLATGISSALMGIPFTGSFADLYNGLANITTIQGIAVTAFWFLSMMVFGFIGYLIVKHRGSFEPYRAERDQDNVPRKATIVYLVAVAAIISFILFVIDAITRGVGIGFEITNIKGLLTALGTGQYWILIPFIFMTAVVGAVFVKVVGSGVVEKIVDDAHINKV